MDIRANLLLEPKGREFKLTRIDDAGKQTEILLSEDNVMALALSAERMREQIVARYTRSGVPQPQAVLLATSIELNSDIHQTHLWLTMVSPDGSRSPCFSLPADVAQALHETLPEWLAKLAAAKPQH